MDSFLSRIMFKITERCPIVSNLIRTLIPRSMEDDIVLVRENERVSILDLWTRG